MLLKHLGLVLHDGNYQISKVETLINKVYENHNDCNDITRLNESIYINFRCHGVKKKKNIVAENGEFAKIISHLLMHLMDYK